MFIELLDGLRCVSAHPQIPLVIAIGERDDRFVVEGVAGCPTCRREYPIHDGIAWFTSSGVDNAAPRPVMGDDEEGATRVGAFLAASDGMSLALVGEWARYTSQLAGMAGLRVFAVNPHAAVAESERVGVVYTDNRLPFADSSLAGVALDASAWSDQEIGLAVHALSAGGRMVAPASVQLPGDIREIARDESVWIGEKLGALVTLHRR